METDDSPRKGRNEEEKMYASSSLRARNLRLLQRLNEPGQNRGRVFQDGRSSDVTRAAPAEEKVVRRRRNRLGLSGSFTVPPPQCGREHFHHSGGMKATPELISESSSQRLG